MAGIYSRVVSMATVSWEQEQGQVEEHRACFFFCGSTFIYGALHAAAAQTAETEVGGGVTYVLEGSSPLLSARSHADAAAVSRRRVVAGTLAQLEACAAGCAALSP